MKVHRNLAIVEVDEPITAIELEAISDLGQHTIAKLSETVFLVDPRQLETLLQRWVDNGLAPKVLS